MSSNSPYKLIFFDNDGTLNTQRSTWEYMHKHLGTWESGGKPLEALLMRDRTPYDEYARQSVRLMKGFPKTKFLERLRTIEIRKDAIEVIRTLKELGFKLAVLSSGFSLWQDVWKEKGIEWDYYRANELIFDENDISTGDVIVHVTDNVLGMDKGSWAEKIRSMEGLSKSETVFVGDGWGDVPGFRSCAFGIAIDPNMPEVADAAEYVLGPDDFKKVLDYLTP
ncbi:MAG: HAD family phosphatase [bacterium]|nr:HAD family phosphatase [bacterium]